MCADADLGMGESLTTAVEHTKGAEGWVIALGDMPYVQPETIRALAATVERGARPGRRIAPAAAANENC